MPQLATIKTLPIGPWRLALAAAVGLFACQKQKFTLNGQDVAANIKAAQQLAPVGAAVPSELPDAFSAARQYYQTRSVVTLDIHGADLAAGDETSLLNTTTGKTLVQNQPVSLGLVAEAANQPFQLAETPHDVFVLLYPADPAQQGVYAYGENKLQLLIAGKSGPQYFSNASIFLKDFPIFAVSTSAFEGNEQALGGLQGEVPQFVSAAVTTAGAGSTLVTGTVNILNR